MGLGNIDTSDYWTARKDYLDDLRFTRGAAAGTCAGYASDLKLWGEWLDEVERDWRDCSHVQVPRCQDRCRLPLGGCVGGWGITDPGLCALRGQPFSRPSGSFPADPGGREALGR